MAYSDQAAARWRAVPVAGSSSTGLLSTPSRSTSTSQTSPGFIQSGGLRARPTPAGVPVRGQLMGSDAVCLAENAGRLGELGTTGVDLNFGCPAKVVNRHGGGAALLADPDLLHRIVGAVRRAVPSAVPVSAKMRLGIDDSSRAI